MNRSVFFLTTTVILLLFTAVAYGQADVAAFTADSPFEAFRTALAQMVGTLGQLGGVIILIFGIYQLVTGEPRGVFTIIMATAFFAAPMVVDTIVGPIETSPKGEAFAIEDESGFPWGWLLLALPIIALVVATIFRRNIEGLLADTDSAQEIQTVDELRTQSETSAKPPEETEPFAKPLSSAESSASVDIDKRKRKVILD